METYRFYPPHVRAKRMSYLVWDDGDRECQHELLEQNWQERILVQDGIVFVLYSCARCSRRVCQSLDEVIPPPTWIGARQ